MDELAPGTLFREVGDRLPQLVSGLDLERLYPANLPPLPPGLLAIVTVFQYVEDLSDEEAGAALRRRPDWRYALRLRINAADLDPTVLADFRRRIGGDAAALVALDCLLARLCRLGVVGVACDGGSRAETVLASVSLLNRTLLAIRTMFIALESQRHPAWPGQVPSTREAQHAAYRRLLTAYRAPEEAGRREADALAVATDGFELLAGIARGETAVTPEITILQCVWSWLFESTADGAAWRVPACGDLRPRAMAGL